MSTFCCMQKYKANSIECQWWEALVQTFPYIRTYVSMYVYNVGCPAVVPEFVSYKSEIFRKWIVSRIRISHKKKKIYWKVVLTRIKGMYWKTYVSKTIVVKRRNYYQQLNVESRQAGSVVLVPYKLTSSFLDLL